MNTYDLALLDRAEGYRSNAAHIARQEAGRQVNLEHRADAVSCIESTIEAGFARTIAAVTLTGDTYADRMALTQAASAHARTLDGWSTDFLADHVERAVDAAMA